MPHAASTPGSPVPGVGRGRSHDAGRRSRIRQPRPRQAPAPGTGWASLTPTELTVARTVAEGLSNPQIAERMFISHRTVATHLTSIFRKLGVSSRAELTAKAARHDEDSDAGVGQSGRV